MANLELGDPTSEFYDVLLNMSMQNSCSEGWNDAQRYHNDVGWLLGGAIFGPIALLFAAVSSPSPDYQVSSAEYLRCYTKKARSMNLGAAFLGVLVEAGLVTLVVVI